MAKKNNNNTVKKNLKNENKQITEPYLLDFRVDALPRIEC